MELSYHRFMEDSISKNSFHLVLGGAGFIGQHLVERLVAENQSVVCIDKNSKNFIQHSLISNIQCDLNIDFQDVMQELMFLINNRDTTVWHLAANSDIQKGMLDPQVEISDTFQSTVKMCQIAKNIQAKKIIFASSSAVYGFHKNKKLIEHKTELKPISFYGALKAASEFFLKSFGHANLIDILIFRFPNVIGPKMTHGLIFDLPKKINFTTKTVPILGSGQQKKPYIHVSDLIDLMFAISKDFKNDFDIYNLGPNDDGIEIKDIVSLFLNKFFPDIKPVYESQDEGWVGDVPKVNLSINKIKSIFPELNYSSAKAVTKTLENL